MRLNWLFACVLAFSAACDARRNSALPPPPGYSGAVPSPAGQGMLATVNGLEYVDTTGAFGGGRLEIAGFSVTPNPVTGKGPVMLLLTHAARGKPVPMLTDKQGAEGFYWVPIPTDVDAADFCERVKAGAAAQVPSSATSAIYREALGF